MAKFKRWLDDEFQKDVDNLLFLRQKPLSTIEDVKIFEENIRNISQWIEHGRITDTIKNKIIPVLAEAEVYLLVQRQKAKKTLV